MADSGYPIDIISIHALHEESDHTPYQHDANKCTFQSTLSMRRATLSNRQTMQLADIFQSTLSMRRATWGQSIRSRRTHFNPRSP